MGIATAFVLPRSTIAVRLTANNQRTPRSILTTVQAFSCSTQCRQHSHLHWLEVSRCYPALSGMLNPREQGAAGWSFDFTGRNRRPPLDPVNAILSYANSLLAKDITVTVQAIGFDPYQGFYHKERYGRPALALDLMEEFRPIIADSVVLWVVNNGVLQLGDFIRSGRAVALKPQARQRFIRAYEKRLDTLVTHPVFKYRISYRRVLEVQARLFGRLLTGEIAEYPGFRTR